MKWPQFLIAGVCLGICLSRPAAAIGALHDDVRRVDAERIDRDPAWLALLHYRPRTDGSMESEADGPQFFLSAQGKHSPRDELLAALAALQLPAQRADYACRFPARYEWLRARLGYDGGDALADGCAPLRDWFAGFPGRRISINFASSYLESPSSTFGHTFLKIYQQSSSELFSPTINYAARTDPQEGELAFVFKGLFGGFPGVVDELPFYRRLRTYTEVEGRDIHEYDVLLTPAEVRRLLLHTWEIRDSVFDYYFVHENCAYRTLTLLDVARPQAGLLRPFDTVTVPVDTIRALRSAHLLGEQRSWPSIPRRVRELETQVRPEDANFARNIALGARPTDVAALPPQRRAATLQLAYEYGSVLIDRDVGDRASRKAVLGDIIRARLALDAPEPLARQNTLAQPEDGHDGGLLALGMTRRSGHAAAVLEFAAFQHTLTDPLPGYEPHAEISLLSPELNLWGKGLELRRIDWLVAQSTIPSSTLLAQHAWRLQLASARQPYAKREHMATNLAYHVGQAWPLGKEMVLSVLPGASIETGRGLDRHVALAGLLRTALTRQGTRWAARLELDAGKFIAGSSLRRQEVIANAEIRLARNLSVALRASRRTLPRRDNEVQLSLRWRQPSLHNPLHLH